MLGLTSGALLVIAFVWWLTSVSEVSVSVRNYALGCGAGAGLMGLVLVHVLFMNRCVEDGGLMMAVNTILGLALTGMAFGTMEWAEGMALYSDGSLMLYFLILLSLIGRYEFMNMKH
jgi:hypothetical protein